MMDNLHTDTRADAISNARVFLSLLVGAFVIFIVREVAAPLFSHAEDSAGPDDQVAADGTMWLQEGVDFLPVIFLLVAFFGVIAVAVFQRGVMR